MRQLGQILEEDLVEHCFVWMSCLVYSGNFSGRHKCQDLMKSMMSKSFVMIATVPEIWDKKYRSEPLIIAAEHTFLDYSHTLPADSKKTWFDSSGPPYLVFGFNAHWEEVWEKDWYLVQCRRYCLWCACYKKAADLSFIVVYGFCLYNLFYIHCSSHGESVSVYED